MTHPQHDDTGWMPDELLPGWIRHSWHRIGNTGAGFTLTRHIYDDGDTDQGIEMEGVLPGSSDNLRAAALTLLSMLD